MDELFGLLDENEHVEPILCGYFNKIVTGLIAKIKNKMLHYLLIKRSGDVYDRLLSRL